LKFYCVNCLAPGDEKISRAYLIVKDIKLGKYYKNFPVRIQTKIESN